MTDRQVEILLVEDNPGDIVLVQEALKDARVYNRLTVRQNGREALEWLQASADGKFINSRPGLIMLDLYMPEMGGLELLRIIKQDPLLKLIPVVVMTSSQEEEDIAMAYEAQANCYITKPVDFEQLTKVVKSIEDFWLSLVHLPAPRTKTE